MSRTMTPFEIARSMDEKARRYLMVGPKVDLAIGSSQNVALKDVPKDMFETFVPGLKKHYCAGAARPNVAGVYALPAQATSEGLKLLVDWMNMVCNCGMAIELKAPNNLVSAVQLSNALHALGIRADANRVFRFAEKLMKDKPLRVAQVSEIWAKLPHHSREVYAMVCAIRASRENKTHEPGMEMLLKSDSKLGGRVADEVKNKAAMPVKETPEQHRARKANNAAVAQESQRKREASHQAYLKREEKRQNHRRREEGRPENHCGGGYDRVMNQGEKTCTGLEA